MITIKIQLINNKTINFQYIQLFNIFIKYILINKLKLNVFATHQKILFRLYTFN
jgi:hypothetical protein